jgi:hypothetical protein
MRSFILGVSALVSASALVFACSSSSSGGGTTPVDSGVSTTRPDAATSGTDSGGGGDDGGSMDPQINGCTTYVDHTADQEVDLQWDFGINQKADHCSKIKKGASVKWTGDFNAHPLDAHNGDANNPIAGAGANADGGASVTITFSNTGTFGYWCDIHMTAMQGAIIVE